MRADGAKVVSIFLDAFVHKSIVAGDVDAPV